MNRTQGGSYSSQDPEQFYFLTRQVKQNWALFLRVELLPVLFSFEFANSDSEPKKVDIYCMYATKHIGVNVPFLDG